MIMRKFIVGILAALSLSGCAVYDDTSSALVKPVAPKVVALISDQKADVDHPVILISIDGFRSDYLDRGITPNLSGLAKGGVRAAMRPSFPSLTFPNHYTLVTGLRPDHHGIVNNTMTDPERPGITFKLSDHQQVTDQFWWDDGIPFWVDAEKAGIKTATMFWPGSEADIHDVRPSNWVKFDQDMTGENRVQQILAWLDLPVEQRPTALTLY
jgi:ectonucleotide pyrophosphatase/phosphodiesterase family protein 5